ncbi:MAG: ChaN family lipoprotein [Paracoccaceae bacterium]
MKLLLKLILCVVLTAPSVRALEPPRVPAELQADIVFLGEIHDNLFHHRTQADLIGVLRPSAVVWEMLTPSSANLISPDLLRDTSELGRVLEWDKSGWPDFRYYAPVFAASTLASHYGAQIPRSDMGHVREVGVTGYFGQEAAKYGLSIALPEDEQLQREKTQQINHCNALPPDLLPFMVDVQRLRDAALARAALSAFEETGGPVVVITGNGHARRDQGAPIYLKAARPDVTTASLGQSEAGEITGVFDVIIDAPTVERDDPCLAFE